MKKIPPLKLISKIKNIFYIALQILVTLLVAYFVVKRALLSWEQSKEILKNLKTINIAISLIFSLIAFLGQGLVWLKLTRLFETGKIKSITLLNAFFSSLMVRYIPGNIWSYLSRINNHKKLGIRRFKTIYLSVIEVFIYVTSGVFVLFITIPLWPDKKLLLDQNLLLIIISAFLILTILFSPLLWHFFFTRIVPKKELNFAENFPLSKIFVLFLIYVSIWLLFGLSLFAIIYPAVGFSFSILVLTISINTAAVLIGFLSFITPSGIGARESVMTYLLRGLFLSGTAAVFAIGMRLINTLSEILIFFLIWFLNLYQKRHSIKKRK